MQDQVHTGAIPRVSNNPFYFSIFFLIIIVLSTGGLFLYNTIIANDITSVKQNIETKKDEIAQISKNDRVVVTKVLLSGNVRPTLDLQKLVNTFRDAATHANVRFKGFSIKKDIIGTVLIATEGNLAIHPDPASTIITMMRSYNEQKNGNDFSLEPINTISGDTKSRTSPISFKVLPRKNTSVK